MLFYEELFVINNYFFTNIPLYAQTQYDYFDDGAAAGGVDRALHGIPIIGRIVVIVVVLALLFGRVS